MRMKTVIEFQCSLSCNQNKKYKYNRCNSPTQLRLFDHNEKINFILIWTDYLRL